MDLSVSHDAHCASSNLCNSRNYPTRASLSSHTSNSKLVKGNKFEEEYAENLTAMLTKV